MDISVHIVFPLYQGLLITDDHLSFALKVLCVFLHGVGHKKTGIKMILHREILFL